MNGRVPLFTRVTVPSTPWCAFVFGLASVVVAPRTPPPEVVAGVFVGLELVCVLDETLLLVLDDVCVVLTDVCTVDDVLLVLLVLLLLLVVFALLDVWIEALVDAAVEPHVFFPCP